VGIKLFKDRNVRRLSDIVDLIYACGLEVRYVIILIDMWWNRLRLR
jgi:hypothetical protein